MSLVKKIQYLESNELELNKLREEIQDKTLEIENELDWLFSTKQTYLNFPSIL